MSMWTFISSSTLLLMLFARSIIADVSPESSVVYDVNDAPLLKKVLKMLDGVLSIDATRWTANLTTEELNTKTSLFHTDVNSLGQLLNLSTTTDWIEWDQKYTTAIQFDNKVTNEVSNADHVDNIVNVVDDLNDVIEVGPGIYVNTNRSELCTKLNMIVNVAKNISEVTGGAIQENWSNLTAPLIDEINNNLPDPSYSKESYDLIKSIHDDLTDLMDFGIPDWSDVPSSNDLREKLHCFASAMNTFSNLTQVYTLDTWKPAVNHFNELTEKVTSTLSPELVNQLEQAVGAFSGMMNVDVNDWAVKTRASLDKDLGDLERAVKQLDQALHRKTNSDWEEDVVALHHELVPSTNTTMTHEMKKFKKTAPHYHKEWQPKASAPPPLPLHEEYKKVHIYIHVTHPHVHD